MKFKDSRGFRNNNPGNIKHGSSWAGLRSKQTDSTFCQFTSMYMGTRALCKLLVNYYKFYNLNTIRKIISRYAPSTENKTENYIQFVAKTIAQDPDREMASPFRSNDKETWCSFVSAIVSYENGTDDYYLYFVHLAGTIFYDNSIIN